jgi:hypothetical protein
MEFMKDIVKETAGDGSRGVPAKDMESDLHRHFERSEESGLPGDNGDPSLRSG